MYVVIDKNKLNWNCLFVIILNYNCNTNNFMKKEDSGSGLCVKTPFVEIPEVNRNRLIIIINNK